MKKHLKNLMALLFVFTLIFTAACSTQNEDATEEATETASTNLSGELTIFHAGSLSVPFEQIEKEFEKLHPEVDIVRTAGGSRKIARDISELDKKADILASADYTVIDTLLIPDYAKWNGLFAKNSMVIMYTDKSKFADEINENNWYEVFQKDGVNFGHSEPNADPCGYRSVLLMQLAEKHYESEDLFAKLQKACPEKNIRPKSVELISLLETGGLDYAFEYESVARQHQAKNPAFKYIKLPVEINLSSMEHADFYKEASIDLKGKNPGETVTKVGEPIVYGLTIPEVSENKELATEFLKFLFDKEQGLKILEENGQPILESPEAITGEDQVPEALKDLLK